MDTSAALLCVNKIIDELLESSSSSDDDEVFAVLVGRNLRPRVKNFVENVINQYSEIDFKKNLRISRESATYLMEKYSLSYFRRSYQGGRQQSTVEKQILSFLWFSGNKTTFREVGNLFDMSLSSIHSSFNRVLKFLVDDVAPEIIKFPQSNDEKEAVAKGFQEIAGFPNILGCVDGSYISARTPKHKIRSTYSNRHDGISITMQGICDSKLKFLDVFTGVPSKIHDSRILKLSFIGKDLPRICSPNYHILGDSAYPLREYLMTPFRDYGSLSESEQNYNLQFCRTRVKIENAFGVLKSRFRQLMRLDFHKVETMAQFIIACCVLHNICIDKEDFHDEEISDTEFDDINSELLVDDRRDNLLTQLGQIKRNELKDILFNTT